MYFLGVTVTFRKAIWFYLKMGPKKGGAKGDKGGGAKGGGGGKGDKGGKGAAKGAAAADAGKGDKKNCSSIKVMYDSN